MGRPYKNAVNRYDPSVECKNCDHAIMDTDHRAAIPQIMLSYGIQAPLFQEIQK